VVLTRLVVLSEPHTVRRHCRVVVMLCEESSGLPVTWCLRQGLRHAF